jgi:hypothetical protein
VGWDLRPRSLKSRQMGGIGALAGQSLGKLGLRRTRATPSPWMVDVMIVVATACE